MTNEHAFHELSLKELEAVNGGTISATVDSARRVLNIPRIIYRPGGDPTQLGPVTSVDPII